MDCYQCLCGSCANNVNCLWAKAGEQDFPCYNCDECNAYHRKSGEQRNRYRRRVECSQYKAAAAYAIDTKDRELLDSCFMSKGAKQ